MDPDLTLFDQEPPRDIELHAAERTVPLALGAGLAGGGDEETQRALVEIRGQVRKAWRDLAAAFHAREAAPLAATFERLCAATWAAYDGAKAQAGGLDFTDLLYRARDLLRDHEEVR